jgi:hypothetical protein
MKKLLTVAVVAALGAVPAIGATAALAAVTRPIDRGSPTTAFTNGPVSIQGCNTYTVSAYGAVPEGPTIPDIPFVEIAFVNRYDSAAKKVRFALRSGNAAEIVTDSGTFSTGTTITHLFSPGNVGTNTVECAVESVTFADGSAWTRHAPT